MTDDKTHRPSTPGSTPPPAKPAPAPAKAAAKEDATPLPAPGFPPNDAQEPNTPYDPISGEALEIPEHDAKTDAVIVLSDEDRSNARAIALPKTERRHSVLHEHVLYQQSAIQFNGIVHYSRIPR